MKYEYPKSGERFCEICKARNIDHTQMFDVNNGNVSKARLDFIYDTKVGNFCTTCLNEKERTDIKFALGIIAKEARRLSGMFWSGNLGAAILDSERILRAEV